MCVNNLNGGRLRLFWLVFFASLILSFTACIDGMDDIDMTGGELESPGPIMSFDVELTVASAIASQFSPVRVLLEEDNEKGQLGYTVVSPEAGTRRYKITVPESYSGKPGVFVVELYKLNSAFDDVAALQPVPIALNLLKSRYITFDKKIIPKPSEKIKLLVDEESTLMLGYGPGGLKLKDIPSVPPIYFINLQLSEEAAGFGFSYAGGVATSYEAETYPPFTEIISKLSDTANIYGFTAPALDWALIMIPDTYAEGRKFSLWLYAKQPVEPGAEHACPCQPECNCLLCPYTALSQFYGQDFYPIHIQIPENIDGQLPEDIVEGLETGTIINIDIESKHFLSCNDLADAMPKKPLSMALPQ
jgi:hypothetical protein